VLSKVRAEKASVVVANWLETSVEGAFAVFRKKSVDELVQRTEGIESESLTDVGSPLFAKTKRLPKLEPWQKELVPWLFGAVEYSERYGSMAKSERRAWRVALVCGVLAIGFAGAWAHNITSGRYIPYVVEIDKQRVAVAVGAAEKAGNADERVVIAYVGRWVRALRTVLADRAAQETLVQDVFAMVSPKTIASRKVQEYYTAHNPYAGGERRVEVVITRVAPMKSATQLTVEWTERSWDSSRGMATEAQYSAFVAVAVSPTRTLDEVVANPLGVYVTDFSVSQIH